MESNQNLKANFQNELQKLNKVQREAVEQIEGPVIVIAGPGTGKTQILSARIGNILNNTDSEPHNILCLTYTDAGTIAMRKRLLKFIGPDAYRVHIYTFHAFCNQVIQDNLDIFGYRDLQPISDLERVELYHQLIKNFSTDNPLKRLTGDEFYDTKRLQNLHNEMKKEGWTPEIIKDAAEKYIEDLPNRDAYIYKRPNAAKGIAKGDIKTAKIEEEQEKMTKLVAASDSSDLINKAMQNERLYDFNDMIVWVKEAFLKFKSLLTSYQERYHYFLVDEYQDTSGAQNDILNLLTNFWEKPNIFVVGDDDQAIYRFQGANISNIIDFYNKHQENISVLVMNENYRSTQMILDASGILIKNNNERLVNKIEGLRKDLIASNQEINAKSTEVSITEFPNPFHEEASLLLQLESAYKNGEDLNEIAIIYRQHKNVENLVKSLEEKKIPLNIRRKVNILDLPLIKKIINIMEFISAEYTEPDSAEHLLYEIMHYDFFEISIRDIAVINNYCRKGKNYEPFKWRSILASRETLFQLNLEKAKSISRFEDNISTWIKDIPNLTVQCLFEKILNQGNILPSILKSADKEWNLQVITSLFDFIKNESNRKPNLSWKAMLELIRKMRRENISMPLNKSVYNEAGINFITAHSSKGLEYKKVYITAATSANWESSPNNNTFKIPDTLIGTSDTTKNQDEKEEQTEDERRLFYVAMTRAKENLQISYHARRTDEKEVEACRFVAELLDEGQLLLEKEALPQENVIEYQAGLMLDAKPEIIFFDPNFIREQLKDYKLSVTHLNKYLRCPLSFYFENILKVPAARNASMGFGSAIHDALYDLFQNMLKDENKNFPSADEFLKYFKNKMTKYHSHFTEQEFSLRSEYGNSFLKEYYNYYISSWNKVCKVEFRINNCSFEEVPLSGALDKIELDGKTVHVIDYKSGKPENAREKLKAPDEKKPEGGDYWRQLVFYKILLDNDKSSDYKMISGEINFIEPNKKGEFRSEKMYVKPEDESIVKDQIKTTYSKIMNLEFASGCGDSDCSWCNFVKNHYPANMVNFKNS